MNCKNCGLSIIRDYSAREIGSWTHYRVADECSKAEPESPESIPWPAERPWETTLNDGDGDLG